MFNLLFVSLIFLLLPVTVLALDIPAPTAATGQTTQYATGDDGDLQKGVTWPSPRFTDNGDGTVTDHLTDLIWLKKANCFGYKNWTNALSSANTLASGSCGLTDGSTAGQWRLPNINELESLVDAQRTTPALPLDHPFTGVQSDLYWSSSTFAVYTDFAWGVSISSGRDYYGNKDNDSSDVWPVRGGQ
jgi:hypothetical protein